MCLKGRFCTSKIPNIDLTILYQRCKWSEMKFFAYPVLEMYLRIEIELSDEPHAKTSPGSYDDHCTELAEESCSEWMYN